MSKRNSVTVIRSVSDLTQLSDRDLVNCLKALREAITTRKRLHADAIAAGDISPNTPLNFSEYAWKAKEEATTGSSGAVSATTPIRELPIRTRARHQLEDLRVLCLEDLSAISERELLGCKDLGRTTMTRLRELLHSVGLAFAEHPNPETAEYVRNQRLRALPPGQLKEARSGLPDDAPLTRLGLKGPTVERAKRAGWRTVGDLRALPVRDLNIKFGKVGVREVVKALDETGAGLRCSPTPLELWRVGVLNVDELVKPDSPDSPVAELRPWVGAVVSDLARAGVTTLGQLREAASAGSLKSLRGVGTHAQERLMGFLGTPTTPTASRAPDLRSTTSSVVNSVFALGGSSES